MKARDKVTILTYRKLRDKMGKAAIIEWQKLCLMLGFDPDPDVTVAIYASPEVEDPHANPRVDERLGPVETPTASDTTIPVTNPDIIHNATKLVHDLVSGPKESLIDVDPTPERPTTKPEKEKK